MAVSPITPKADVSDRDVYDILIIGGGINGTAIARDAVGRGLSVLLCERDDLGSHTSSASTKLIHGGLRYLEHYDFKLVRHALQEREVLLRAAPHIIWPLRFVLPYEPQQRPKWLLRLGLFVYDNLGGRKLLPATRSLKLDTGDHAGLLQPHLKAGFEYSDCWVEDARLVVLNARDAADRGASIRPRTEVVKVTSTADGAVARLRASDGVETEITARCVVNAAGPWVDHVAKLISPGRNGSNVRLVKGSHIVIPRHYAGEHSYIFQNDDGRIIFAIPYERNYTLIGTTDVPYRRGEGPVVATQEEIAYLCEAASEYFAQPIRPDDVCWTYSGVRPLFEDHSSGASDVTRDYVLDLQETRDGNPILSVYGGKITTSRHLAEHAMSKLSGVFTEASAPWTRHAPLPGGDVDGADFGQILTELQAAHPALPPLLRQLMARRYGRIATEILRDGPGEMFGLELCAAEISHLVNREWATSAEDILWRRTKAGLHLTETEKASLDSYIRRNHPSFATDDTITTAVS